MCQNLEMLFTCVAASLVAMGARAPVSVAAADNPLTPWKIEYAISGGRSGRIETLTVEESGRAVFVANDGRRSDQPVVPAQLAELSALLRRLQPSAGPRPAPSAPAIPDALNTRLTITPAGQEHPIDLEMQSAPVQKILSIVGPLFEEARLRAQTPPFDPGRVWKIIEGKWERGSERDAAWEGVWTRRGSSNLFDGFWVNRKTREGARDVLEIEPAGPGRVTVYRQGIKQRYHGNFDPLHPGEIVGRGEWFGPDERWQAIVEP